MRKLQMRKLLMTISLIVLLLSLVGCGKTTKPKPRSIDITGNWTVLNPPKPSTKGFPKDYVPPTPTYIIMFSTNEGENRFALAEDTKNSQGTYILSGTTIQLIPAGKNFVFEFGKTKEEDKILGDGLVWVREGTGTNGQPVPSSPSNSQPTPTPTPTPTPNTPTPTPNTPTPTPTPVSPNGPPTTPTPPPNQ